MTVCGDDIVREAQVKLKGVNIITSTFCGCHSYSQTTI